MQNIKALRVRAGLTQSQFANALGVARTAVTMWEMNDTRYPRGEMLPKIAKVLNCKIDDLYAENEVKEAV